MKTIHALTTFLALSTFASAWPWPPSMSDLRAYGEANGLLARRQNNNNNNNNGNGNNAPATSNNPASTAAPQSSGSQASSGGTTAAPTSGGSAASSGTPNSSGGNNNSSGGGNKGNSSSSLAPVSDQDPAGGVQMITPAITASSQYYKVDNTITWVWNYTSLLRPPAAIDILASISPSGAGVALPAYTLANNASFNPTQTFTWDTGEYASNTSPLPVGTYTLIIYDAAFGTEYATATAGPGSLGVYEQFRFGMYTGQPRVDLSNPYICATCNAAGAVRAGAVWSILGVAGLTVASFMWFAGGWGVFM